MSSSSSLAAVLAFTACVPTIRVHSPEAVAKETRHYEQPVARVQQGVVAALKSMGYEVVRNDGGRVRTAPKVALITAYGSAYSARAVESSVAWDVRIDGDGGGTTVVALPRAYAGGQAAEEDAQWNQQWFDSFMTTFYRELDDALDAKPLAAEPEPEPATPSPKKKGKKAKPEGMSI